MAGVAFIGLGVMGFPMAGHLTLKGGHDVTVYNRSPARAAEWVAKFGCQSAASPMDAAKDADFVFTCVGNDDDLRSVTIGENGVLAGMNSGAVLIDNTTASAEVARELEIAARSQGIGFVDAPVSGGQAGAENAALTVMCGGDQQTFDKAKPVIEAYARMVGLMGPVGSGQLAKMMNQICIAGVVQGLAEAIHFGKQSGLDIENVIEVISKGAAGSWQMENRYKTMVEGKFDFGFAVDWMRKDLNLLLTEARRNGSKLPMTALVDQFYGDVQSMGGNRWDTSSLLARLDRQ
ncbi:NAD(P)-dependent oxidoreductase [Agrobacterium tumefaciens]|uniref:NAD(P)-dependent oxidoreductase n=1 Tax=Agrobacterium tumefaciens TaxID=358 RepID=UPI001571ADD4|nr:NAD(P)-dependent oxidoreductase [Agrobacterium tumefaciens]